MVRRVQAVALAAALVSCALPMGAAASEAGRTDGEIGGEINGEADRPVTVVRLGAASEAALDAVTRPLPRPAFVQYTEDWLSGLPVAAGDARWRCLTEALYFEARGEEPQGQFAVAEVILNRVDSGRFPDSVCAVIAQGTGRKWECQFTYTCDGLPETVRDRESWSLMGKIARLALDGAPRDLTDGALFYHTRAVSPSWSEVFFRTTTIGAHHFYSPDTQIAMN